MKNFRNATVHNAIKKTVRIVEHLGEYHALMAA